MVATVASTVLSQAGPSGAVAGARCLTHVSTLTEQAEKQVNMGQTAVATQTRVRCISLHSHCEPPHDTHKAYSAQDTPHTAR
jgi:hypothetical protein